MSKPKIYCFINMVNALGYIPMALAEDGTVLAEHASSNESWARHDIGITSDWKHDKYVAHYPYGYELEWVDDVKGHAGLQAAIALAKAGSGERAE